MLVWRNLSTRYRQMVLGIAWGLLEPLLQVLIISLFFGLLFRLPSDGIPYPLFILTGLLPWFLFTRVVNSASMSMRDNMDLISKIDFPRIMLPASAIVKDGIDGVVFIVFVLFIILTSGVALTTNLLFLPIFMILVIIIGFTIGLLLCAPMVRYRDLGYIKTTGLQFWMYASPIVYSPDMVPSEFRWIYELNPLYWMIEGFRWCLLAKEVNFTLGFASSMGLVAAVLIAALYVFSILERKVVDYQ